MQFAVSLLLAAVMLAIAFEVHHWFRRANPQLASALLLIGIISPAASL